MTSPASRRDHSLTHVENVRTASVRPAVDDLDLDQILLARNEGDVRLMATILRSYLRTPAGQAAIVAALNLDHIERIAHDAADKAARHAINTNPVPPHEHRAQDVVITTRIRGLSRIGMAIGAVIGGLLAWLLVSNYTISVASSGTPEQMYSVSVTWIKVAIVAITVALFAVIGALFGPRKKHVERQAKAEVRLESTHMHQGRVPAYSTIATTARRANRTEDNQ